MAMDGFEWDDGDVTKLFDLKECLGEGTYGTVWTAIDRRSDEIVAVKIQNFEDDEDLEYLRLEIELMRRSQSPYTVQFKGCFKPSNKEAEVWIAMEHCLAGSLADVMNVCETTFSEELIQQIAAASCLGIAVLHEANIIHRDIKAGNILLNSKGNVRITDLGVGADLKTKDERRNTLIGAPYWMAPEIMLEKGYDNRVDVWSLGITVIELADSVPPNAAVQGEDNILKLIPTQKPPTVRIPANFSPEMNSFISRCVTRPYPKRPSAKELLSHPFIADTVLKLKANKGRSKVLAEFLENEKSRILRYRKADETMFQTAPRVQSTPSLQSEFLSSRFSRMYSDLHLSRPESIRNSVMLPTQSNIHGEKVISREAQRLLTQEDVKFMVRNREIRESIKSGVITPHFAQLLKDRRTEEDSLFDQDEEEEEDEEITKEQEEKSNELHNKLLYYYSKHHPAKLKDTQNIEMLVQVGMQYGEEVVNNGLEDKYGEKLPLELPAQTKRRQRAAEEKAKKEEQEHFEWLTANQEEDDDTVERPKTKRANDSFPATRQRSLGLEEVPIPVASTQPQPTIQQRFPGLVKSNEKTHQSVRILENFGSVKAMFEKSGGGKNKSGKKKVKKNNQHLWEVDLNPSRSAAKPTPQYKQPHNRFIQPFHNVPLQRSGSASKGGSFQSKWTISPMGFTNDKKPQPAAAKNKPKKFNEIQSWWEKRQQGKKDGGRRDGKRRDGKDQRRKNGPTTTRRSDIKRLL